MKAIRPVGSVLCAALLASACADSMMAPTGTDRRASPPAGGPSGYMLPPVIVVACSGSYVKDDLGDHCVPVAEEQIRDGSGDGGGGTTDPGYGGGGGGGGSSLPGDANRNGDTYDDGPVAFGSCVAAMALATVPIATLIPLTTSLYDASGALSRAELSLKTAIDGGFDPAVIVSLQTARDHARDRYNSAVWGVAAAGGGTVVAIGNAVVRCAPFLYLPTP